MGVGLWRNWGSVGMGYFKIEDFPEEIFFG